MHLRLKFTQHLFILRIIKIIIILNIIHFIRDRFGDIFENSTVSIPN